MTPPLWTKASGMQGAEPRSGKPRQAGESHQIFLWGFNVGSARAGHGEAPKAPKQGIQGWTQDGCLLLWLQTQKGGRGGRYLPHPSSAKGHVAVAPRRPAGHSEPLLKGLPDEAGLTLGIPLDGCLDHSEQHKCVPCMPSCASGRLTLAGLAHIARRSPLDPQGL